MTIEQELLEDLLQGLRKAQGNGLKLNRYSKYLNSQDWLVGIMNLVKGGISEGLIKLLDKGHLDCSIEYIVTSKESYMDHFNETEEGRIFIENCRKNLSHFK